jgi:molecular chaperone DnaJ
MAAKRDYYEVLGLSKGASEAEIKKAYRRLARKLHPDVNPGDKAAQKRFQEVQEAYEVLKDDDKRRAYDRFGHAGPGAGYDPRSGGTGFPGGFPGGGGPSGGPFEGIHFETGDLGDLFGNLFGGRRASGPQPGEDIRGQIEVPFRDAVLGGTATLSLRREKVCTTCGGTGRTGKSACPKCRGEGMIAEAERVPIKIPEGTEDGATLRVRAKGGPGISGGPVGDLYVTVRVTPHSYFERQGNDIHGIVPITVKEAYAGAEIGVPTIHGTVTARIPPGTQGRQRFRLRGKGVKDPRSGGAGDHIYSVRVMIPKTQSQAGMDAATLLDSLYEGDVRAELPKGL